jgi:predicted DNA-binding WGR domain protein
MSNWTVQLELAEGTSSKFWRARVEDGTLYINYGKVGSAGQTQVKDFGDAATAQREYDTLIHEKRTNGYVDLGIGAAALADEDEVDDETYADDEDDDDTPAVVPRAAAARPAASPAAPAPAARVGKRFVLETGNRTVETYVSLDGNTVRMDSSETYSSPEAAKKAEERLTKMLLAEGYTEG